MPLTLRLCLGLLFLVVGAAEAAPRPYQLDLARFRRNPYDLVGQLLFYSGATEYVGSGTVIRPRSILTAGHNVFDAQEGWSTRMDFRRANYGTESLNTQRASRLLVLGSYRETVLRYGVDSVRSFATDTAGAIFPEPLASGRAAIVSRASVLLSAGYSRAGLGYGAEGVHTGDFPLVATPYTGFRQIYGQFWENSSIYIEGGMSGGPLFSNYMGQLYVVGVIVSGSSAPDAGGIRAIDVPAFNFVWQSLL